ncbi:hypothetical protein EV207_11421 [Scopulibacillus darangshiensis]|uniref:Spore germination protein GerPA/GerPF n=1 Tax=Scopulibacillus darangshiensis TaxID=442528 RepID=A0A4R2P2E8_9BACL|nr:hypothetical protein [Scopulibacillus darangshiensis]TCP28899.1 hypothetical protein EV207_11421 [Scopulibacillus darangshiensis]
MEHIHFKDLKIGQITRSSGVFSGKNQQGYWSSKKKENQGFGTISGKENKAIDHINIASDPDRFDP